jgi:polar amino acid transport system substrate-binding protein
MRNKVVKMVREILVLLLSLLLSLTMTLSSGFASNEKALVLVGDKNYIPIEYLHEGTPNGLNVEFLQELSKTMGRKIHIRLMQWKDAQQKVLDGEADGLTVLSITEKRKKLYDFSEVTLEFEFSLFVRSDEVRIFDVSDLEGKSVGVTEGGFPRQVLESNSKINLVFIKNYPEGFHLLTSHEIDAVGADTWVGGYIVQEHGIKGVKIAGKPFAKKKAAIAVKKGNLKLLNDINLGIRELKEDGTIQKIIDKWSPKEVVFLTKEKIHSIIWFVSISLLLLLLVAVLFWILMLRKQVKTRTGLLQKATDELEIKVKELKAEITERKRGAQAGGKGTAGVGRAIPHDLRTRSRLHCAC